MEHSIASENKEILRDYEEGLQPMRERARRYENFYRGRQYSRREKSQLIKVGLIPLVVNIVKPLIGQRRAILTSSKPTWKVVPLQGASKLVANALQQFLVGKWNSDYADISLNKALKDALVTGMGFLFLDLASFLDNALFGSIMTHLGWRYVYPDPNARMFDLSDAENIIIRKNVSLGKAQVLYKMTEGQARESIGEDNFRTSNSPYTQRVDILDRYSKFPIVKYEVTPTPGEHIRDIPRVFYSTDLTKILDKEERDLVTKNKKLEADIQVLQKDKKLDFRKYEELSVYRTTSVGERDISARIMNIRDYPIISFLNEEGDRFSEVQGDMSFVEGIQKAFSKFYLLTIQNAMLTGNVRVMGPKNAVKDKAKFQKTASTPGAYVDYEPDPTLPDGGKPTVIQGGSLPSAFYGMSLDLLERAKFTLSVFSPGLGDPKGSPETFSTTATLVELGNQSIKELARRVDVQIAKAGEVMIQFIQNYAEPDHLVQFLDLEGEVTTLIKLNEIEIKEGVVQQIKNDSTLGKFLVKVLTQPNLGSDRLSKAAMMRDMVMNKAIPATPVVMSALMDLMEFPRAAAITEDFEKERSATQQASALAEQNKKLVTQLEASNKEVDTLAKRVEMGDFKKEAEIFLVEAKAELKRVVEEAKRPTNGS